MSKSQLYYMNEDNFFNDSDGSVLEEGPLGQALMHQLGRIPVAGTVGRAVRNSLSHIPASALEKDVTFRAQPFETAKRKLLKFSADKRASKLAKIADDDFAKHGFTSKEALIKAKEDAPDIKTIHGKEYGTPDASGNKKATNLKHLFVQPLVRRTEGGAEKTVKLGYDFQKREGEKAIGHRLSGLSKAALGTGAAAAGIAAAGYNPTHVVTTPTKALVGAAGTLNKFGHGVAAVADRTSDAMIKGSSLTGDAAKKLSDTKDAIVNKASDVRKAWNDTSTTKKVAVGAGVGAAALGGAALAKRISDKVGERLDWKVEGCDKISDPDKKAKCKEYVSAQKAKSLKSSLSRCEDANNPEECRKAIEAEIKKHSK